MLSQTHLIYLGIAVVIVIVAFFAYQELQKHKMEIQKLRFQSEKLQKIIHAYNMKQWQAHPEDSDNEEFSGREEEESEDDEPEESQEEEDTMLVEQNIDDLNDDETRQVVNDILQETLSSLGGAAKNAQCVEKARSSSPEDNGKTQTIVVGRAVTSESNQAEVFKQSGLQQNGLLGPSLFKNVRPAVLHERKEDLPLVDTFDIKKPAQNKTSIQNNTSVPQQVTSQRTTFTSPKARAQYQQTVIRTPPQHHNGNGGFQYTQTQTAIAAATFVKENEEKSDDEVEEVVVEVIEDNNSDNSISFSDEEITDNVTDEDDKDTPCPKNESSVKTENKNIDENVKSEEENTKTEQETSIFCPILIKNGQNKGNECGRKAKINGLCLTHFRSTTKN